MRTTQAKLYLLFSLVAAGLIACLLAERRTWSAVDQANKALRVQLSQLDALLTDNHRLMALLSTDAGQSSPSKPESDSIASVSSLDEPAKELFRLRAEA